LCCAASVTILPCLLSVFEGESFSLCCCFWPSFFHSFLQFPAAVCQIIALGLIVRSAALLLQLHLLLLQFLLHDWLWS
jgi:hypothetical protein